MQADSGTRFDSSCERRSMEMAMTMEVEMAMAMQLVMKWKRTGNVTGSGVEKKKRGD